MQKGAFVLIDCLGFKGIWKRVDPEIVIAKFIQIKEIIEKQFDSKSGTMDFWGFKVTSAKFNVQLLSDTVAISFLEESFKNPLVGQIMVSFWINQCVINILDHFIQSDPPLVLRGCINYGEYISKGNFIVGPAVDEAAENMNIAEGAFVWLLPKAAERFDNSIDQLVSNFVKQFVTFHDSESEQIYMDEVLTNFKIMNSVSIVSDYEMPVKNGKTLKCHVINPLIRHKTIEERQAIIETYSKAMTDPKLEVLTKKQNTMKFLEQAVKKHNEFFRVSKYMNDKGFGPKQNNI